MLFGWAHEWLLEITVSFGLITAFIAAVTAVWKKAVRPAIESLHKASEKWEAGGELLNAQLTRNHGTSLLDRVEALVLELENVGAIIAKISRKQDDNRAVQDERHEQNSTRLDELANEIGDVRDDVLNLNIHSEYMMRLFSGLPAALSIDGQAAWRRVLLEAQEAQYPQEDRTGEES